MDRRNPQYHIVDIAKLKLRSPAWSDSLGKMPQEAVVDTFFSLSFNIDSFVQVEVSTSGCGFTIDLNCSISAAVNDTSLPQAVIKLAASFWNLVTLWLCSAVTVVVDRCRFQAWPLLSDDDDEHHERWYSSSNSTSHNRTARSKHPWTTQAIVVTKLSSSNQLINITIIGFPIQWRRTARGQKTDTLN